MYSKEEAQKLRTEFWAKFGDYTKFFSRKVGEPVNWVLYKTGIKGLELKFDLEKKVVRVALEVNAKSEERRFDIFVELDNFKSILESGFEREVFWEEDYILPEGKEVSRIFVELDGVKFHNPDNWPEIFRFMAENMYQLQSNFIDIQDILKEKFGKPF